MIISNPIHTTSAHLIWQSPLSGKGSRRRLPVAVLEQNAPDQVSFAYLKDTQGFAMAQAEGFNGYTGIPFDREDTSDAIETISRRLPNPERPDYREFLARFGLEQEHDLPTLSLLAYTGAKLTSDSFSLADTFAGFDRPFEYIFDVAGRRHYIEETPSPEVGQEVFFEPEPENKHDPNAVALKDTDGRCFGYLNTCQAKVANSWLQKGSVSGKVFRQNGRASYPRLFVFASIVPKI